MQYAYIAGMNGAVKKSRHAGADATRGTNKVFSLLKTEDVFPLNVTGVTIDGIPFSAPHRPHNLLDVVYGPDWHVPRDYS